MFTDSHCHIFSKYYDNIDEIIKSAKVNKVLKIINNGTSLEDNEEVLRLAKKYDNIYAAIGFHPDSTQNFKKSHLKIIENNIDKIVAIGEIGLDYHYEPFNKRLQIKLLEMQLSIAEKYKKPVIIHSRDATDDTIKILLKYPTVKGVIHCFNDTYETALKYIEMGYKLGINGIITFNNSTLVDTVKKISVDAIVLETDSPYLSPVPLRGKTNKPENITIIAEYISKIKEVPLQELSKITERNIKEIFDI